MSTPVISQAAAQLSFEWHQGDPVNLRWIVADSQIAGTYDFKMLANGTDNRSKLVAVEVLAVLVDVDDLAADDPVVTPAVEGAHTLFVIEIDASVSATISNGRWPHDLQMQGGVTRYKGSVTVASEVKEPAS